MRRRLVIEDGQYLYDLAYVKGEEYYLSRNDSSDWTPSCRGEIVAELIDDGIGVDVTFGTNEAVRLNYTQIGELKVLLDTYSKSTPGTASYELARKVKA